MKEKRNEHTILRGAANSVEDIDKIFVCQTGKPMQGLKKVGGGNKWKCLCPFHNENTASFNFDLKKRMYYCFGCHNGDILSMLAYNLHDDFPELKQREDEEYWEHKTRISIHRESFKENRDIMKPSDELIAAERLARKLHKGQFRRDGKTPYIKHVESVAKRVQSYVTDRRLAIHLTAQTVAWLHDIIEDTDMTAEGLADLGFARSTINSVVAITKVKGEAYEDYLKRVKKDDCARQVKILDMIDNLADKATTKQMSKYAKAMQYLLDNPVGVFWEEDVL